MEIHEKCVKLVKRKPAIFFNFKKMKKYEGICNWSDIEIDYRKEFIATSYHECVHYIFPDYSETMVKYIEKRIINTCTPLDIAYFAKLLTNKIYKSELQKYVESSEKD